MLSIILDKRGSILNLCVNKAGLRVVHVCVSCVCVCVCVLVSCVCMCYAEVDMQDCLKGMTVLGGRISCLHYF